MSAIGSDVRAVLDAVAAEAPVGLIGHSMGGMAVLSFAEQHPEEFGGRIGAVVLADTAASDVVREMIGGLGIKAADAVVRRAAGLAGWERLHRLRRRALKRPSGLGLLLARITNFGPDAAPSVMEHVAGVAARIPAEVWTGLITGIAEMDLGDALRHVTVPALVVVGDRDRLTPAASARALASRLPRGELATVARAGHCTMLEHPEEFNRLVRDFVGAHLGGAGIQPPPARGGR
jgi:pimeloyl-ACP methyl ester carboxylesterase